MQKIITRVVGSKEGSQREGGREDGGGRGKKGEDEKDMCDRWRQLFGLEGARG
jgi:hypothetical protein